jgi:signal transduction histidine kinase
MITDFFNDNMVIIRVIYAMLFFLYSFAIVIKINRRSELKLAKSFWLLSVYGFSFGLNELFTIYILVNTGVITSDVVYYFWNIDLFVRAFAFMVIFWLGIRLVREVYPDFAVLYWGGLAVSLLWTLLALFTVGFRSSNLYVGVVDNLSRYMLAAPGLFLTGYGLLLQVKEIEQFHIPGLVKHVRGLAYTFFCGVFLIGLVASHPVLWPAVFLNRYTFAEFVGLPIIFFRSIYLIFTTYFVVKIVNVFEVEREYRLEQALKRQVLAEERDRIARELHDGIIQSIYGVGLKLKQFKILLASRPEDAVKHLDTVNGDLDNIIVDIRDYITELHLGDYTSVSLREALSKLVEEFRNNTLMAAEFSVQGKQEGELNIVQVSHILQIVRELLSNALKHSRGSKVWINLNFMPQELTIHVVDNGCGFKPDDIQTERRQGQSQGLNNIFYRVNFLQGTIVFHSSQVEGTHFQITIPYSKLNYLQSSFIKDPKHFGNTPDKGEEVHDS